MPRCLPSAAVIAVAAAALVLAGCTSDGSGGAPTSSAAGQPVKSFESATVAASGSAPGESTLESASPSTTSTPIADFTKVSYGVPAGFVKAPSGEYSPAVPLEDTYQAYYLVPRNEQHGRDLLAIVLYTLPSTETVDSSTDQLGRLKAYNTKLDATAKGGIDPTTVAGLPGYSESATQPPDFHYAAWFAFGAHHLLTLSCQIETKKELASLSSACGATLISLAVS